MTSPNFILAYVADAPKSAALYSKLLDAQPVESSPNWAMFAFPNGLALGLWSRDEVEPRATLPGGVARKTGQRPRGHDRVRNARPRTRQHRDRACSLRRKSVRPRRCGRDARHQADHAGLAPEGVGNFEWAWSQRLIGRDFSR